MVPPAGRACNYPGAVCQAGTVKPAAFRILVWMVIPFWVTAHTIATMVITPTYFAAL
jgi:hypothetical protein